MKHTHKCTEVHTVNNVSPFPNKEKSYPNKGKDCTSHDTEYVIIMTINHVTLLPYYPVLNYSRSFTQNVRDVTCPDYSISGV
jgi:hypothetical protein